ncbi:MAG: hypothetical protein IT457_21570 [Planctomycetes bacterium]|nr:hypothetical protein [Planctomycetota bacterium]
MRSCFLLLAIAVVPAHAVSAPRAMVPPQQASEPAWSRPQPFDFAALGVQRVAPSGGPSDRVVAIDFPVGVFGTTGPERLPLARAVADVQMGTLPDGSLCVLAGGVDEELDVYHFEPGTGAVRRFAAAGGRRLPERFGAGLGSWPLFSPRGFAMFAYEKDEHVEFRAATAGRALASRALPIDCEGFRAELDERAFVVRVRFFGPQGREIDRLEFVTPDAPRLVVEGARGGVIDFGEVPLGEAANFAAILRNSGASPLQLDLAVEGVFALGDGTPRRLELTPGGAQNVVVGFAPTAPGRVAGRLLLRSAVVGASTEFVLRGVGLAIPSAPVAPAPSPTAIAVTESPPAAEPAAAPPPELEVASFEVECRAPGSVLVDLILRKTGTLPPKLVLKNQRTGSVTVLRPDASGRASGTLAASPLDPLALATRPDGEELVLGAAPPALRLAGDSLIVLAPPRSPFLLVQVLAGALRPRLFPGAALWQGRADESGSARVGIALVGAGPEPVHLVLVVPDASGAPILSEPIEIGPSAPPSGRDRTK